jgi:hypothetical protein
MGTGRGSCHIRFTSGKPASAATGRRLGDGSFRERQEHWRVGRGLGENRVPVPWPNTRWAPFRSPEVAGRVNGEGLIVVDTEPGAKVPVDVTEAHAG